jgi:hypothetical protein
VADLSRETLDQLADEYGLVIWTDPTGILLATHEVQGAKAAANVALQRNATVQQVVAAADYLARCFETKRRSPALQIVGPPSQADPLVSKLDQLLAALGEIIERLSAAPTVHGEAWPHETEKKG